MLVPVVSLRPGRFEVQLLVPLPTQAERRMILDVHCRATPLAPDVDLDDVAARTDGKSGADLESLCREATICALREDITSTVVCKRHFDSAL